MKTENKQYRLKRWYPSLDERLEVGDVGDRYLFEFGNGTKEDRFSVLKGGSLIYIPIQELHPDFWELIEEEKQPLFVTDDGVELFDSWEKVFIIDKRTMYKPREIILRHWICFDKANFKVFAHEANADEYIWRNKPVFSMNRYNNFEDMMKAKNSIILIDEDIEKAAKERSKE